MFKLGMQTGGNLGTSITLDELYALMSQCGFDSVDFSLMNGYNSPLWKLNDEELRERMLQEKSRMDAHGLYPGQTHTPLDNFWGKDISTKEARWHAQIQAIKATSYLGCPYAVIHPINVPGRCMSFGREEAKRVNLEYYRFLRPYLEEYNVRAAVENLGGYNPRLVRTIGCDGIMGSAEELIDLLDALNADTGRDTFVACLDIGHAACSGEDPVRMIYALGKRYLHVTHVHDNSRAHDDHNAPGAGVIPWYEIGKALNDIGFDKVFSYEADFAHVMTNCVAYRDNIARSMIRLFAEMGRAVQNAR